MKTIPTLINRQYCLSATTACTITSDSGITLCTAQPGEQKIFTAISRSVYVSDSAAVISLLFGNFTENSTTDVPQPYHADSQPAILQAGHVYDLGVLSNDTDLTGLMFSAKEHVQTAELWLSIGNTELTIIWPTNAIWPNGEPVLRANTAYRFALRREPNANLIINLAYEYSL